MKHEIKPHGLIIPQILTREQGAEHILGAAGLEGEVINQAGNWQDFLPEGELQNKGFFEPNACTSFGTNNAVETLMQFYKGSWPNYSDRALAIASKTDPNRGNDPHVVAECARTVLGFVPESTLPFNDSIKTPDQFYDPNPLSESIINTGRHFFDEWEFRHNWVWRGNVLFSEPLTPAEKKAKLKDALTKGTVCVSVLAWNLDPAKNVYTKPDKEADNHWGLLVKYDEDDRPVVLDSYAEADGTPFLKTLDSLYDFNIAKVYYLTSVQMKLSILSQILNLIGKLLQIDALIIKQRTATPIIPPDQDLPPPAPPVIPLHSKIRRWALAVQGQEGFYTGSRSFKNRNPGNLKFTAFTQSLGATGKDADNFCIFPTYDAGFEALCGFLTLAAQDKLKDYHQARTLQSFTQIYANPPPDHPYAENVANDLNCTVFTRIETFL